MEEACGGPEQGGMFSASRANQRGTLQGKPPAVGPERFERGSHKRIAGLRQSAGDSDAIGKKDMRERGSGNTEPAAGFFKDPERCRIACLTVLDKLAKIGPRLPDELGIAGG